MRPPLAPTLAIDAAAGVGWVAVLDGERTVARRDWPTLRDATARLPHLAAEALAESGIPPGALDLIAVVAGPGSFTGLRASLAFAHGLALASGATLVAVTAAEAAIEGQSATPESVARAAARRRSFLLPPLAPLPVYAGPAQARAAPMRPAPA
jgi:tRNA threonylcarbamoyladenosine biosynthesis protein TsaB